MGDWYQAGSRQWPDCRGRREADREARGTSNSASGEALGSPLFPFFDGSRPIVLEQPRQRAIGEQLAAGLTARAVVTLVFGVHDPLDRCPTGSARLSKSTVNGHVRTKGGDFFREPLRCFISQSLRPTGKHILHRIVEASDLLIR